MTILDISVGLILLIFLVRGLWIGFIRQTASILALVLGFIAAGQFYGESGLFILPYIKNQQIGFFIAYLIIFLVVFLLVHLAGLILKKVVSVALLGWFDRSLGGIFGGIKGICLACLLFLGLSAVISSSSPFLRQSLTYPYLKNISQYLIYIVQDKALKKSMLPPKPPISDIFSTAITPDKKNGKTSPGKSRGTITPSTVP
ncbi:MAG: CvpA family protein [Thermodesulfobacteriota bacterium]